jgi:hypothetical protein
VRDNGERYRCGIEVRGIEVRGIKVRDRDYI